MVNLAAVVRGGGAGAAALVQPTARALEFWLATDPRSLNWWWNELSVPARIADTALLFAPHIRTNHTLEVMVKFMERANYGQRTGANLDDEVATAIKRAALLKNESLMALGFARLWHELRVTPPTDPACLHPPPGTQGCATDGIQVDHSFHQHGPVLLLLAEPA